MTTSTKKALKGWNNTFVPKSLKVNVREWLAENDFSEDDVECIDESATFANFKSCMTGKKDHGMNIIDYDKMSRYCDNGYMDSFLRDAIFDAVSAIA